MGVQKISLIKKTQTQAQKYAMRKRLRSQREYLAQECKPGEKLVKIFDKTFNFSEDDLIAGYWPVKTEVDVIPLLTSLHKKNNKCLLPVVRPEQNSLLFRKWKPGDRLKVSDKGIPEPSDKQPIAVPRILLVPLLAFDNQGNRLGYGGGHYDGTLSQLRANEIKFGECITAIGIAYAGQEVDKVPCEEFDQRLNWVVTEKGASKFLTE